MSDASPHGPRPEPSPDVPADTVVRTTTDGRPGAGSTVFAFRRPIPQWTSLLLGVLCLALVLGVWWFLTRGPHEERLLGYNSLPSPAETFNREQLHDLWFGDA